MGKYIMTMNEGGVAWPSKMDESWRRRGFRRKITLRPLGLDMSLFLWAL